MLQEGAEGQEPVWLLELCQLYKIKATDADANSDSEQYSTSTGSEMECNFQTSENSSMSDKTIAQRSPDVERPDPESMLNPPFGQKHFHIASFVQCCVV